MRFDILFLSIFHFLFSMLVDLLRLFSYELIILQSSLGKINLKVVVVEGTL